MRGLSTNCLVYYHFIHTIYRPFLIAESALTAAGQVERANAIWLRQACRNATDSAEDSIVLTREIFKTLDSKGVSVAWIGNSRV
jgi:hypothetical protein